PGSLSAFRLSWLRRTSMFDLGLGSLQARPLEELFYLLVMLAACVLIVIVIGFEGIVTAIVLRYAIPIFAALVRRAWYRIKSRLRAPMCGSRAVTRASA